MECGIIWGNNSTFKLTEHTGNDYMIFHPPNGDDNIEIFKDILFNSTVRKLGFGNFNNGYITSDSGNISII